MSGHRGPATGPADPVGPPGPVDAAGPVDPVGATGAAGPVDAAGPTGAARVEPSRRARLLRFGILALAAESGLIAGHALFFPRYFYEEFLFGRGWVQMLPPYNEHITRDLGALYLGFFVVLGYAALRLTRDVVRGSVLSFLVASVPHLVFHTLHTEDAPLLLDKVLQVGLLSLTVALCVAVLWGARRVTDR